MFQLSFQLANSPLAKLDLPDAVTSAYEGWAHDIIPSIPQRLSKRGEAGWSRVRAAIGPILQAGAAAGTAFLVGYYIFGHDRPFFAALAAWVCLGWSFERELRRVAEIAIGVTIGVTVGDLVVKQIGTGWWQLSSILVVSTILARFVDSGKLLTTQAGSQAIIITGLAGDVSGGPYGRALDAAIGGAVALLFTILTPYQPSKAARKKTAQAIQALSSTASLLASGLRKGYNPDTLEGALKTARSSESLINSVIDQATGVRKQIHWTVNRKYEKQWAEFEYRDRMLNQALRSLQVLARRMRFDAAYATEEQSTWFADILGRYSNACLAFAQDVKVGHALEHDRQELTSVANALISYQITNPVVATGAALFRAVIVDTLKAAGATQAEADAALGVFPGSPSAAVTEEDLVIAS